MTDPLPLVSEKRIRELIKDGCTIYKLFDLDESLRFAINQAIRETAEACEKICDEQAKEPECPERAEYCADEIRRRMP